MGSLVKNWNLDQKLGKKWKPQPEVEFSLSPQTTQFAVGKDETRMVVWCVSFLDFV